VLADAYVAYAQLLERAGERARAITMYREAARLVGGVPRARDQAKRALERLSTSSTFFDFFFRLCLTSCASRP